MMLFGVVELFTDDELETYVRAGITAFLAA